MTVCQWLYLIEGGQEKVWGPEASAMAETARSGIPVLPAFVLSREAVAAFYLQADLKKAIKRTLKNHPPTKPETFAGAAKEIRAHIVQAPFPKQVSEEFAAYVHQLQEQVLQVPGKGLRLTITEVGSSYHQSVTEVVKTTLAAEKLVKKLLALSFTEYALHQRLRTDQAIIHGAHPILVQFSEEAAFSGTAYAYDFGSHDDSTIVVRAHDHEHARADRLAGADEYKVDRSTLLLLSRNLARHSWAEKRSGRHVSPRRSQGHAVLSDEQVLRLAKMVKRAQAMFEGIKCFHWQFAHNQLFISRVEALEGEIERSQQPVPTKAAASGEGDALLVGLPGNLGWASGPVRLVKTRADRAAIADGEVVVMSHSLPDDAHHCAGAAAIIFETGHHASREAHLAKQIGIPAVIGTGTALSHLKNGQMVTVDGTHGAVYAGVLAKRQQAPHGMVAALPATGTKVYSVVLDASAAHRDELGDADGIGLLRSEFILQMLGVHPQEIVRRNLHGEYADILREGVEQAVRSVYPKPVIYQLHDVHSAQLLGWRQRHHDRHEPNPKLGYRGTHRLLSEPEVLGMEFYALRSLMAAGVSNLQIMLPMVRSLEEVVKMEELIAEAFKGYPMPAIWVKCETPALAIRAEDLCALNIAGICIDISSLTSLIVGMDHENHQVGHHADQTDPAVLQAMVYAIATCREHGVASTIVAEHDELRPEVVQAAIEAGVTGVAVLPSDIAPMHGLVASIEQRLVLDHLLNEHEQPEA